LGHEFKVVFCLSFFSHIPDALFRPWLERVFSAVEPNGILIFTTHGAVSAINMQVNFDANGFYWNFDSDQRDIDANIYGEAPSRLLTCSAPWQQYRKLS
jgi:2-polyprenyl-3-methyl-5-hydroxy-6-metoxy-1,4-benzoquinol methylase